MAATSSNPEAIIVDIQETTTHDNNSATDLNPINHTQRGNPTGKAIDPDLNNWRFERVDKYRPLYDAVLRGDLRSVEIFLKEHPEGLTAGISSPYMSTALHIAAMEGHSRIVEKLVQVMPLDAIALPDNSTYTAFKYALIDGNINSIKAILQRDLNLGHTMDSEGYTALHSALLSFADGQEEMPRKTKPKNKKAIWLLSVVTRDDDSVGYPFTGVNCRRIYAYLIYAGYFDICLYLLKRYPDATSDKQRIVDLLHPLAYSPSHFRSGSRLGFWETCIYSLVPVNLRNSPQHWLKKEVEKIVPNSTHLFGTSSKTSIGCQALYWIRRMIWRVFQFLVPNLKYIRYEKKKHQYAVELTNFLLEKLSYKSYIGSAPSELSSRLNFASNNGITEIVMAFFHHFPDMIWVWRPFIQEAIEHRRHQIFSLFNMINGRNKMLFLRVITEPQIYFVAAKLSPFPQLSSVPGSAFQMQRELQWFKEVEKFIVPFERNRKEGEKTAWEVFVEEHKELQDKAEKWMKDTSNYCMVVAALIATVVFAAAFSVPGGNNSNNGVPIFIKKNSFMVFAVFNTLALLSSITSILIFLSILTSRYATEDFLRSLPRRMVLGLANLFFAIATTLVSFSATLSMVLDGRWKWAYIPITLLASVPIVMFAILQFPLFIQMIQSSYGWGVFSPQQIW